MLSVVNMCVIGDISEFELSTTMDVLICKPSYHGLCNSRLSKFIGGVHIFPSMLLLKHRSWEVLSCHI